MQNKMLKTSEKEGMSQKTETRLEDYEMGSFAEEALDQEAQSSQDSQLGSSGHGRNAVQRQLKPRHVSMIALGGTIGTGLFIGIESPLRNAGPVGALISYLFMGSIAYCVTPVSYTHLDVYKRQPKDV